MLQLTSVCCALADKPELLMITYFQHNTGTAQKLYKNTHEMCIDNIEGGAEWKEWDILYSIDTQ